MAASDRSEIGYLLFWCDDPRGGDRHRLRHAVRLEVISLVLRKGGLRMTARTTGPLEPMRGKVSVYAPDGSLVAQGTPVETPKVRHGDTLTLTQDLDLVSAEPSLPGPDLQVSDQQR